MRYGHNTKMEECSAAFCKLLGVLLGLGMTVQAAMHFLCGSIYYIWLSGSVHYFIAFSFFLLPLFIKSSSTAKSPTTNSMLLRWFGLPRLWNASSKDKGGMLPNLLLLASLSMAVSASLYSLGVGIFNSITYPLLLEPLFLSN
ncbi:hypothetical protein QOT17_021898 [Balamuthia mandrillaris]